MSTDPVSLKKLPYSKKLRVVIGRILAENRGRWVTRAELQQALQKEGVLGKKVKPETIRVEIAKGLRALEKALESTIRLERKKGEGFRLVDIEPAPDDELTSLRNSLSLLHERLDALESAPPSNRSGENDFDARLQTLEELARTRHRGYILPDGTKKTWEEYTTDDISTLFGSVQIQRFELEALQRIVQQLLEHVDPELALELQKQIRPADLPLSQKHRITHVPPQAGVSIDEPARVIQPGDTLSVSSDVQAAIQHRIEQLSEMIQDPDLNTNQKSKLEQARATLQALLLKRSSSAGLEGLLTKATSTSQQLSSEPKPRESSSGSRRKPSDRS